MRAPEFWRHDGLAARLLAPAGWLYGSGTRLRFAMTQPRRVPVPVLCVGNLVAGGAGKTPTAIALAKAVAACGRRPAFLTRGYGGRLRGPVRVDPRRHNVREVGDEALLLARHAPAWVGADRGAAAAAAVADAAEVLIMDDGLQNPGLAKDLSFLVVDAGYGLGNGRVIPAGPLREPARAGLERVGAVVRIEDPLGREGAPLALPQHLPSFSARLVPDAEALRLTGQKVLGFAGIGRPEKFFDTLRGLGAVLVDAVSFPDHHPYRPEEVMAVLEKAAAAGAVPVTTEKDLLRLPEEARAMVRVLAVELAFAEPERLLDLVRQALRDG